MKGFLKVALSTAVLTMAFVGSAFAYGEGKDAAGTVRNGKNYQSNVTGTTTPGKSGFVDASPDLVKNVNGQKTHTEFKSNTNSCASCHMTHTANADGLLFGSSTQATCIACHDGSLGFYNVKTGELFTKGSTSVAIDAAFAGEVNSNTAVGSNAGSFDSTKGDSSMHNVEVGKTLATKGAPGGNYNGVTGDKGKWEQDFTCASCHAPHGSYSDRLLHYNPNGFAEVDIKDRGFGLLKYPGPAGVTDEALGYPVLALGDLAGFGFNNAVVKATGQQHIDQGASLPAEVTAETVIMVYTKVNGTFKPDSTPWTYAPGSYVYPTGYTYANMNFTKADKTTKITKKSENVHYDFGKAFAYGSDLADAAFAKISRASVVDLDLVEVAKYTPKNLPLYVVNNAALVGGAPDVNGTIDPTQAMVSGKYTATAGLGQKFSKFCATCHTDYLAGSGARTGHYNNFSALDCGDCHTGAGATANPVTAGKFRHTTTNDSFSCARCHLTHGTNNTILKDAEGKSFAELAAETDATQAAAHLDDVNPSSAIKRYTNMAVCWSCHTDNAAESLVNNKYYQADKFTAVTITGNADWTSGNRVGFGSPWGVNKLTGGTVYKDAAKTNSWKSSDGSRVWDSATNTFMITAAAGKTNTISTIAFTQLSYGMFPNAVKGTTIPMNEGGTQVGTVTLDNVTRTVTGVITAPITVNGSATGDEKVYTFTIDGVLYTLDMK